MGTQFSSKCSGCSARGRDFLKIFRMFRPGTPFSSKFSGCPARARDFLQYWDEEDELERSSPV